MFRQAFSTVLLATLVVTAATDHAVARPARGATNAPAAAGNTQFLLFNLAPAGTYAVSKNGTLAGSYTAGPSASLIYEDDATTGDRFEFLLTGIEPVQPSRPGAFSATGSSEGCAQFAWNTPAAGEYVTDYSLLWGHNPGVYTDSVNVSRLDVVNGGARSFTTRCGFASGTYHFALRAHNSFDLWSPLSDPSTTSISNENTQGPVPPGNVRVTEPSFGCATVTWSKSSDPTVVGYRVYFGLSPRTQAAYTDSIDAGNNASATRCGLAQGTYYFSVRAITSLGLFSAYSREVSLAAHGVDVAAPVIAQRSPAPGATNVPLNASIFFVASDDKTGVDAAGIVVRVDGQSCPLTVSPTSDGTAVQCVPPGGFAADVDVDVEVTVPDRADPANTATSTWTFHTGTSAVNDVDAPVISAVAPVDGATGVDPRPTIEVDITDSGLGVDLGTIVLEVNGAVVAHTISGTPSSARISYRPATDLPAGEEVQVRVEACDRAPSANCAAPLVYRFTVQSAAIAAGQGAIVPDGFWADDPRRPLEVRNLPREWAVRIFDAAGLSVRYFQNDVDGNTWAWDFTNDDGRRVAPALYLVRVLDSSGAVHSSGRFLVQSQ
jgi:hypothetical protein